MTFPLWRELFGAPTAGSSAGTNALSQDIRRPCERASKHSHNDDGRGVRVKTPRLIALSPEQEREAIALLGQLLLDAAARHAAGVSGGVLGGAYPGAFGSATSTPAMPGKAHRHT